MTQINSLVYTLATKNKVIKPSQWKDDMYISLTWLRDDDEQPPLDDDGRFDCGCHFGKCRNLEHPEPGLAERCRLFPPLK